MNKLKLRVSPWFFVMAFLFILNDSGMIFFIYFFTIISHELMHSLVAEKLGYALNQIELMPYGAKISMQNNFYSERDEILIASAGPLFNLLICILCVCCWWIFPNYYNYTQTLFMANLITLLFNCIPVYPLDGGRILGAFLSRKTINKKNKILKSINIILLISFIIIFVISIFFNINWNFLIISIFLFLNLFKKDNKSYYDFIFKDTKENQLKNGVKVESYAITQNSTLFDCFKIMKKNKKIQFFILNEKYEIIKNLSSQQIEQLLLSENTHSKLIKFV